MPASSFLTTYKAGEGGEDEGGAVVGVGGSLLPVGGDIRRYPALSPAGDSRVRDGVDGGDAKENKYGGGTVVGSVSGNTGG